MAHIHIIQQEDATGTLKADYDYLSESYGRLIGNSIPAPQVYRTSSIVEPYFNFGVLQNRTQTANGMHSRPHGPLLSLLVNFAVARFSSCFY